MSPFTARNATSTQPSFKLTSVTRGMRFWSWFTRHSDLLWVERTPFAIFAEWSAAAGTPRHVAWQGPLNPPRSIGAPVLNWFEVGFTGSTVSESFTHALKHALGNPPLHLPPDTDELLARTVSHWGACKCKEAPESCTAVRHTNERATIVIIDERCRSRGSGAMSASMRRQTFELMVATAYDRHPGADVSFLRPWSGTSGRWLSDVANVDERAFTRSQRCGNCPAMLLEASHVYTMEAHEGMLALLAGAPVHVFGEPYYAGWGLTADFFPVAERTSRPTLRAFFHAVFVQLARYLDPITLQPGSIRSVLDMLDVQRDVALRYGDVPKRAGIGFQLWKRPFATPFLSAGNNRLRWIGTPAARRDDECAVLWGASTPDGLPATAPRLRVEDGFLHSAGLGSDLSAPQSQVVDRKGIYFDAAAPNDLLELLNTTAFSPADLLRAAKLRKQIVAAGVTKYNLGRRRPQWKRPHGLKVVLVVGQVEDDASVRLGCPGIRTAESLLHAVRAQRPAAWIVYRPHPDVLAGNRKGHTGAMGVADIVDARADIVSLIEASDEVHTLTSLAGFDALLRGKAVFTYGMPFYAGWGLTHDAISRIPHRNRNLTLDMLVAGALIRYPLYWDWQLRLYTTPEATVARLARPAARPLRPVRSTTARTAVKTWRWIRNVAVHTWWLVSRRYRLFQSG